MKNAVFGDITPCIYLKTDVLKERATTIIMVRSIGNEMSALTRATRRNIPEDGILLNPFVLHPV
jgi:hypothetical protein